MRRPYRVSQRWQGPTATQATPTRARSFSDRERAMRVAHELAAQPATLPGYTVDAIVFGPDPDLVTGRLVFPDGSERDLMDLVSERLAHYRAIGVLAEVGE
jgi:hypothetical protein